MYILYNIGIHVYHKALLIASLFNQKAKQWVAGRKSLFEKLKQDIDGQHNVVWFHAASLGEFEQGRPVIEAFRQKHSDIKILLTFFSPSGYEIRKDYKGADYIYYLPIDTNRNVKKFISIVNPKAVVFIKYEFWFNYLNQISKKNIPIYFISAIFRSDQHFFKWYGGWFRKHLRNVNRFFVQNEKSMELLDSIGIINISLSGDTRFDRVKSIVAQKKEFSMVDKFASGSNVLLAGSSWPSDEKLLPVLFEGRIKNFKLIIAPHEIHEERIHGIEKFFKDYKPVLYSRANDQNISDAKVLIIDGMGFLSSLYQYCKVAFIGGGFGKGIHNILEAVTFGKPVVFGPNYHKFSEAVNLIHSGGAFSADEHCLISNIENLFHNVDQYEKASAACNEFINENTGATEKILDKISF